jgi:hypothetical protein
LLDANPLEDTENTQRIAPVVSRGWLPDRAAVRKMLAEVEQRSSGSE